MNRRKWLGILLMNVSMLAYILWLMLPAVQVRLRAVTGMLTLAVFGIGVLLDVDTLANHWREFALRALAAAALPLFLLVWLQRGGSERFGYYAQQLMFWFPLLWCAHARRVNDRRITRFVFLFMGLAVAVTTLTTIGWLIQGMLREEGKVFAYARSLGNGEPGRQAYLNELMGRNIGGYGFVYASVFMLPFTFYLAGGRGWKRWTFAALYILQLVMIVLSQYTYAIVFAAAITGVELFGLLLRSLVRRMRTGLSLLCAVPVIVLFYLLRVPIVSGLQSLAESLRFANIAYSLGQLLEVLRGGGAVEGSRLAAYSVSLNSFLASPLVGGLLTGQAALGMHAEILDALAATGVIGTAVFAACVWIVGRGMGKGLLCSPALPHLALQWLALLGFMAVGTVFYAREISLVVSLCALFAVWTGPLKSGIMEPV